MNNLNGLFDGSLDAKMNFLDDAVRERADDGLYKVDLSKVKDKKRGWRSVIRFLPNVTKNGEIGESAFSRISHYVNIKEPRELSGFFDSPKNFGEPCALSSLFHNLKNSKNAILEQKADLLNYSKYYYSYILVLEDEQQPELVGKIMIYKYGVTIKDKIASESKGEITGTTCNVFDLNAGKDFILIAKENQVGERTYPDYKMSTFKHETSSLPIYFEEKKEFKNAPLNEDGIIDIKYQDKIKEILTKRDHDLEDFEPKRLTDEDNLKINDIIAFMTNKSSSSFSLSSAHKPSAPTTSDFDFESNFDDETPSMQEEDDFFKDL